MNPEETNEILPVVDSADAIEEIAESHLSMNKGDEEDE